MNLANCIVWCSFSQKLRSLPKGGRLVPGLLEHVSPSNLPATEEATAGA